MAHPKYATVNYAIRMRSVKDIQLLGIWPLV